jgi:UDP-glucose 4-epimerase
VSERVLVTGASGFVGPPLVAALLRSGHAVRAAVRNPQRASLEVDSEVVPVSDFSQPVDWGALLAGVEAVVHLAGIAHLGLGVAADLYDQVNHRATADLSAACARTGVRRLVFLSSVRAQSGSTATHTLRETDVPQPTEPYGRSKLAGEAAVRASGVPWTILRPVMIYGAGAKGNLAQLRRLADTPLPLPFASFANKRSLVGLDNLIAAVLHALAEPRCTRQTYLVADPEPVTLAQIVAALREGMGRPRRLFAVAPALFAGALKILGRADTWERLGGSLVVDPSELIATGWHPDVDTRSGLARFAQEENSRR